MKKEDKHAYKSAISKLDLPKAYVDLRGAGIYTATFEEFQSLVKVTAIQAVRNVVKEGYSHSLVNNFPVKAISWFDSGDIFCEVTIYVQEATGSNKR